MLALSLSRNDEMLLMSDFLPNQCLQRTVATQGSSGVLDFTTRLALADGFRQRR
jgi:hypothetical protein